MDHEQRANFVVILQEDEGCFCHLQKSNSVWLFSLSQTRQGTDARGWSFYNNDEVQVLQLFGIYE